MSLWTEEPVYTQRGQFSNFTSTLHLNGASLVAQMVKNLLAAQETWVQFLNWEDPLEAISIVEMDWPGANTNAFFKKQTVFIFESKNYCYFR